MNQKIFTVTQVNQYVKSILEDDLILSSLVIQGEVSNYKYHNSGHIYFTLKDANAAISAVMFKSYADLLPFKLENGLQILVFGYISLYDKTGQYQLYAEAVEPAGLGSLQLAFEQLKAKLLSEGLFDSIHKKPIPQYPTKIGIVTALTGAALQDIITIAKRRNKNISLIISPAQVQGQIAAKTIVAAIQRLNDYGCDVIIVGRGGGSLEDLWAFNEEIVARAVFKSKIPIISAVGHETDFTIIDFVADLRASTPSAAAELAVPCLDEMHDLISYFTEKLNKSITDKLQSNKNKLLFLQNAISFKNMLTKIFHNQIELENSYKALNRAMCNKLLSGRLKLEAVLNHLEAVSPIKIMNRGFGLVYDSTGSLKNSVKDFNVGDMLKISMADGMVNTTVNSVEEISFNFASREPDNA